MTISMLRDGDQEFTGPNRLAWEKWRWVAGGDALITEAGDYLRITDDGTANPYAEQDAAFETGAWFRVRGSARSDGTMVPFVLDGAGATVWEGSDSTDWQAFDVFVVATADEIRLVSAGAAGYTEWDVVEVYDATVAAAEWIGTGTAAVRKDGTASAGSQCLRITSGGTGSNSAGQDAGLVPGRSYRVSGAFAGDGTAAAVVYAAGNAVAISTSSTAWQEFSEVVVCDADGIYPSAVALIVSNPTAGRFARFDTLQIVEVFPDGPERDRWLRIFGYLFPRARAWVLNRARTLGQWVYGLTGLTADARAFADLAWVNLDPQQTDELDAWEKQFQIPSAPALTEQARRDRLEARWSQQGGQTLEYLQDQIHGAGFTDVYLHEWMIPETDPVQTQNPVQFVEGAYWDCGDPGVECGESDVECGLKVAGGYLLVNKIRYWDGAAWAWETYSVTTITALWSFHIYVCGKTFGDPAEVPAARRDEFEDLLLTLCPAQHWLALRVDYV